MYLNFFLTSLVEIPGNAFAIYAMNRLVYSQLTENLFNKFKMFLYLRGFTHDLRDFLSIALCIPTAHYFRIICEKTAKCG